MQNRYDFVYLFDVKDGNPNGDPDAGNMPRIDPETGHGLVTDVCLKRKVRNFIGLLKGEQPPFEIYVKDRAVLNSQHDRAWESVSPQAATAERKRLPKKEAEARQLTEWMCRNFFDIRAFGAVMTTDVNCGQVRGPLQLAMGRSVDPVVLQEHAIVRCAVTNQRDLEKERTMARRFTIPYGLYRVHGFFNPHLAQQTGFNANGQDLDLFWKALEQMFELDRSAVRGEMTARKLVLFRHDSPLGNAPAHKMFERVKIERSPSADGIRSPARSYGDYVIAVNDGELPAGISILQPF